MITSYAIQVGFSSSKDKTVTKNLVPRSSASTTEEHSTTAAHSTQEQYDSRPVRQKCQIIAA
jgi:hypothetical protein